MSFVAQSDTFFAPAARASAQALDRAARAIEGQRLLVTLINAMPGFVVVVNEQRQIVGINQRLLDTLGAPSLQAILGLRPGEALGCLNAKQAPGGCGTSYACAFCGAAAMTEAWSTGASVARECHVPLPVESGGALDLEVLVTPAGIDGLSLLVVAMRDISGDKRRRVLERTFFHDVLNAAAAVHGVVHLLGGAQDEQRQHEYTTLLMMASQRLIEEIRSQQQLMNAESGDLVPKIQQVDVRAFLRSACDLYQAHDAARERELVLEPGPPMSIATDPTLLLRVIGNMLKNALEAVPKGEQVRAGADDAGPEVVLWVHNSGEIPHDARVRIFQRSFTTKGTGRGIGTYSIKMLGEHYLGGRVGFTTSRDQGTRFHIALPKCPARSRSPAA